MRMNHNRVSLMGNLAQEPKISTTANGKIARLRVLTSTYFKDKSTGEMRENTQGHEVVVFNERAVEVIENYGRKGDHVWIEGALETRKWKDKDENDRYSTEVVVRPYGGDFKRINTNASEGGNGEHNASRSDSNSRNSRNDDQGGYNSNGNDRVFSGNRDSHEDRQRDNHRSGSSSRFEDDLEDMVPF